MIGDFSENESFAILAWMETFSFNEEYKDRATGQLTLESIKDGLPILAILKDAEPSYFSYIELDR